ncbi:MAG: hypothetical protein ACXAC8_01935 [Candidatus Hodarchaeales archaeon]
MKSQRKLYADCLELTQTSDSIGYCAYYGRTISFCSSDCQYNYLSDIQEEGDMKA